MSADQRILIVNPFGIGDVLFTTPLLAVLKEQAPSCQVSYLVNARVAPIFQSDPRVDSVFVYERDEFVAAYKRSPFAFLTKWQQLIQDLKAKKFNVALDVSMGSPVGVALVLAGISRRIGFDYKGRGRWLTDKVPFKGYEERHVCEHYFKLFDLCGWMPSAHVKDFPGTSIWVPDEDKKWVDDLLFKECINCHYIVIYPGGGSSWGKEAYQKRWSVDNYVKLSDKIIEKTGLPIILMGSEGEKELCVALKSAVKGQVVDLAGRTTILRSAALAQKARCVIANDGGPLHIAVASGARTVSIFGPVDPAVYGPYPSFGHKVATKKLACQPCYRRFRMSDCQHLSCLKDLTVDEVFAEVKDLLASEW